MGKYNMLLLSESTNIYLPLEESMKPVQPGVPRNRAYDHEIRKYSLADPHGKKDHFDLRSGLDQMKPPGVTYSREYDQHKVVVLSLHMLLA